MDEKKFRSYSHQIEVYLKFSDHNESDFFNGYLHGLRRCFYGENFGNMAEHEKRLKENSEFNTGYRFGFRGISPAITIKEYNESRKPKKQKVKKQKKRFIFFAL